MEFLTGLELWIIHNVKVHTHVQGVPSEYLDGFSPPVVSSVILPLRAANANDGVQAYLRVHGQGGI